MTFASRARPRPIVVRDLTVHRCGATPRAPSRPTEEVPGTPVKYAIFGHGMGRVELISPTTPDSGVARFLASRGEGLHHVCIEVEDIEAAMDSLRKAGAPLIDQEPRPGAGGARVAFVHPKGMRGVLTELRQGPAEKSDVLSGRRPS